MNSFRFGSRILKETASLLHAGVVKHVYIAALHEEDMNEHERIDDNREVRRVRLRSRKWPRCLIVQLLKYVEFCVRVIRYAGGKDIKIVNIHNLALLPLGVYIKWICGAKLVYDAHELETETYGLRGLRQSAARFLERVLIKYADLVIVVGNSINEWYRDKYGLTNIVTVLNCPEMHVVQRGWRLHHELRIPEDKKIAIYQGGLVEGRGVRQLLEVFSRSQCGNYVLVLMGYGELEPLIREYAASHENIYFKEAVAPSMVLQYTASADVGISYIDNPSLNDHYCLPNKLFEYIMAGLPVIVNDAPEMRRLVCENKIGIVLNELTSQALTHAYAELASIDKESLSKNLKRTAESCSWGRQAELMVGAYKRHVINEHDARV